MREVIWITVENDKRDIRLTYNEVKETNRCKHKYILAQTYVAPGMTISFSPLINLLFLSTCSPTLQIGLGFLAIQWETNPSESI